MKHLTLLVLGITLSGCIAHPKTLSSDDYLVDPELRQMCHYTRCYFLDLIGRSSNEIDIAKAYGLPTNKVYSWGGDRLIDLMINPPNSLYTVTQLSEHEFKIPRNKATQEAYFALEEQYIEDEIGGSGNNGGS